MRHAWLLHCGFHGKRGLSKPRHRWCRRARWQFRGRGQWSRRHRRHQINRRDDITWRQLINWRHDNGRRHHINWWYDVKRWRHVNWRYDNYRRYDGNRWCCWCGLHGGPGRDTECYRIVCGQDGHDNWSQWSNKLQHRQDGGHSWAVRGVGGNESHSASQHGCQLRLEVDGKLRYRFEMRVVVWLQKRM